MELETARSGATPITEEHVEKLEVALGGETPLQFILLKNGDVIVLLKELKGALIKQVHGYNLASPSLRAKSYRPLQVDWNRLPSPDDVYRALRFVNFYMSSQKDGARSHSAEFIRNRHQSVIDYLMKEQERGTLSGLRHSIVALA